MMNGTWTVVSDSERILAESIVDEYLSACSSLDELIAAFKSDTEQILKKTGLVREPFAKNNNDISNNVIAQIAYIASERIAFNGANGVVLTSNILAEDMVRMSLIEWLYINSDYSREELYSFVFGNERWILSDVDLIHKIVNLKWYDPCVGGGVYPLSIIMVLRSLGISTPPFIYGKDVNPLYVEATRIRVALTMHGDYKKNYKYIERFYMVGDALDSHLLQTCLFDSENDRTEYDIVVGNPPYVSAGKIDHVAKKKYSHNYTEIKSKRADLYTYFIAHGLNSLSEKGILTYVSPAQFQMSNYGKSIREVIEKKAGVLAVADFNELPVFNKIAAHISVYALSKGYKPDEFLRYEYDELCELNPLSVLYTKGKLLSQKNVNASGWNFSSGDVCDILQYLSENGVRLKDYSVGVFSGIKSGCKKAFWLREDELHGFTEYDMAHVKKMLIPKNIRRWHGEWSGEYFAIIKKDEQIEENSNIFKHMLLYKEDLQARTDVQNHSTWYGLRECNYYDYLFAPKILYPDIATECRFMMDREGLSIPDGAFFLPEENYYLLGILNSCIGRYYFKEKCARIGNPQKGGRIRFKKVYVEDFPVIPEEQNSDLTCQIAEIAKKGTEKGMLEKDEEIKLDELAMKLYSIPTKYKKELQEA